MATSSAVAAVVMLHMLGLVAGAVVSKKGSSHGWMSWLSGFTNPLTGSRRQATAEEGAEAASNATEPLIPYISGIWQITYEYNEMVGPRDNLEKNPCYGPFPYRYTWNVYIWQKVCECECEHECAFACVVAVICPR